MLHAQLGVRNIELMQAVTVEVLLWTIVLCHLCGIERFSVGSNSQQMIVIVVQNRHQSRMYLSLNNNEIRK